MLATSTAAALAVVGFHRAALAVGASQPSAVLLSLMLGGASVLWPYGTTFYSEACQAAMFIWAAVYLLEGKVGARFVLLAFAGLIKVTSLVFVPGFLAAVLSVPSLSFRARLRAAMLLARRRGGAPWRSIWRGTASGSATCSSSVTTGPRQFRSSCSAISAVRPAARFVVLLLSPGKSILLWAPVLVLSSHAASTCPRPLLIGVATSAICGLVFYGLTCFRKADMRTVHGISCRSSRCFFCRRQRLVRPGGEP